MQTVKRTKIAIKGKAAKGRQDIYVQLGENTITRYNKYFLEGDYSAIAEQVSAPPTTRGTVRSLLIAAAGNIETKVPMRIAQAIQGFYLQKEKTQIELNK